MWTACLALARRLAKRILVPWKWVLSMRWQALLHVHLMHPHFKAVEAGQTFGEYQLVTSHWRGAVTKMTHVVLWNAYEKQLSPRRIIELAFLSPQQVANELGLRVETRGLQRLLGKYPVDRMLKIRFEPLEPSKEPAARLMFNICWGFRRIVSRPTCRAMTRRLLAPYLRSMR